MVPSKEIELRVCCGEVTTKLCIVLNCARNSLQFYFRSEGLCLRQHVQTLKNLQTFCTRLGSLQQNPMMRLILSSVLAKCTVQTPEFSARSNCIQTRLKCQNLGDMETGTVVGMMSYNISGTSILHEEEFIMYSQKSPPITEEKTCRNSLFVSGVSVLITLLQLLS